VLVQKRLWYVRAGREHKKKILDELIELFGYHRKAAIRALRAQPKTQAPCLLGRPREYDPNKLLAPLKTIWLQGIATLQRALEASFARMAAGL